MAVFEFVVLGNPVPLARPRFFVRGGKPRVYDGQFWQKQQTKNELRKQRKRTQMPKISSFRVEMTFHMPVAQSLLVGQKNRLLWGFSEHNTKPDLSNLIKFYEDCLIGVIFSDDALISSVKARKCYSSQPRTEIKIMPVDEINLAPEANEILSIISPQEVSDLVYDAMYLKDLLLDTDKQSSDNLIHIAAVLSRISGTTGKKMEKIAKKYSEYWKKVGIHPVNETLQAELS